MEINHVLNVYIYGPQNIYTYLCNVSCFVFHVCVVLDTFFLLLGLYFDKENKHVLLLHLKSEYDFQNSLLHILCLTCYVIIKPCFVVQ